VDTPHGHVHDIQKGNRLITLGNHMVTINRWWIGSRWICTPSDTATPKLSVFACIVATIMVSSSTTISSRGCELPLPLEGQLPFCNVAGNEVLLKGKE